MRERAEERFFWTMMLVMPSAHLTFFAAALAMRENYWWALGCGYLGSILWAIAFKQGRAASALFYQAEAD